MCLCKGGIIGVTILYLYLYCKPGKINSEAKKNNHMKYSSEGLEMITEINAKKNDHIKHSYSSKESRIRTAVIMGVTTGFGLGIGIGLYMLNTIM